MSNFLLPRLELTPEQLRIVELEPGGHRVVFGPPGSGKTQVLIHRAAHLTETYNIPPERYRVLVFTNVLKDYIRLGLDMLDIPAECVTTFAQWCGDLYRRYVNNRLPWNADAGTPDFDVIQTQVLAAMRARADMQGTLDFVLIDEGQDLGSDAFEILKRVARHVTVFADHHQQIFEAGASEDEILRTLGLPRRNATLLAAYRNSPDVAQLASYFISDANARKVYLAQVKNNQSVRERPLCFIASSEAEEMSRLAEVIHQRLVMNQRIGIIVSRNLQVSGIAAELEGRGIRVRKLVSQRRRDDERPPEPDDELAPGIATYHSAKGLTFDCVLLPRLCESSFPRSHGAVRERLLFVGVSRATQWVYMSTVAQEEMKEFSLIEEAAERAHVVLQKGSVAEWFETRAEGLEDDEFSVL